MKSSAPAGTPPASDAVSASRSVLVRGAPVAHVEPKGLADTNLVADRQRAAFLVRAKHGAHQKVAATVLGAVLVDDQACEDPA